MPRPAQDPPWYASGLRFTCARSGACCTGPTGRVWVDGDEVEALAKAVNLLPFQFLERYTRRLDGRRSLVEIRRGEDRYDCVFLERGPEGARCAVHRARPRQCRTWPFWPENLESAAKWEEVARGCRGVANGVEGSGERFSREAIERQRDLTPED